MDKLLCLRFDGIDDTWMAVTYTVDCDSRGAVDVVIAVCICNDRTSAAFNHERLTRENRHIMPQLLGDYSFFSAYAHFLPRPKQSLTECVRSV